MLLDLSTTRRRKTTTGEAVPVSALERRFLESSGDIAALAESIDRAGALSGAGPYAGFTAAIAAASRHLEEVIGALAASKPSDDSGPTVLAVLRSKVIGLFEPTAAARGQTLSWPEDGRGTVRVAGSPSQLRQVALNILANGSKFSPDGSTLLVETAQTDSTVTLFISDEGPGIAKKDRERAFTRFERLKSDRDGMGLGLALARHYVRSIGGDVTIEEPRTGGCTVAIALPRRT
ncbi:MAG: HAMP domain-containing sensor histidine kinase [Pacificimonas sp.]|jgi:two-component system sensor histidine kinase KdpD|nr:HAMP domain-containing sensor histidine kinase [Pacificimonas sp.]